ncbi:hypothetical protein DFAR_1790003 [Desulfarculales bacterium]
MRLLRRLGAWLVTGPRQPVVVESAPLPPALLLLWNLHRYLLPFLRGLAYEVYAMALNLAGGLLLLTLLRLMAQRLRTREGGVPNPGWGWPGSSEWP